MAHSALQSMMSDINAGRTVSSQPIDLPRIFAEHAARESYLRHRDVTGESFHRAGRSVD